MEEISRNRCWERLIAPGASVGMILASVVHMTMLAMMTEHMGLPLPPPGLSTADILVTQARADIRPFYRRDSLEAKSEST